MKLNEIKVIIKEKLIEKIKLFILDKLHLINVKFSNLIISNNKKDK